MKIKPRFLVVAILLSLAVDLIGCSSIGSRGVVDSAAAVGAGGIAYEASGHNLPITAGAAVGGGILADAVQGTVANQKQAASTQAYAQGQMDATKQLYWASRNLQKGATTGADQPQVELMDVNLPAQEVNGVKTEEQTITIPITKN
jgi:uncharacterized protein YceK